MELPEKDAFESMQIPYKSVIKEEWEKLDFLLGDAVNIVFPMTTNNDTAVHLAVYSGKEEPTRGFLAVIREPIEDFWRNGYGNTPLHEAASVGNLEAVKLLVQFNKNDMLVKNIYGETPLYRAARCGHLDIVEYFLDDCEDFFSRNATNWIRATGTPIIHAAIQSENFDVVLKLVEFEKSLLAMTDPEGRTALHMLANMPSTFKSGTSLHYFDPLIYYLLPDENMDKCKLFSGCPKDSDDSQISDMRHGNHEDVEAGPKPNRPRTFRIAKFCLYLLYCLTCLFWKFFMKGWPQVKELHKKKRQHKVALRITKMLAQKDLSWRREKITPENNEIDSTGVGSTSKQDIALFNSKAASTTQGGDNKLKDKVEEDKDIKYDDHHETPLLLAAANGIIEIVENIFEAHPQAVDYVTDQQRNMLHVAIAHRQRRIFDWIRKRRMIISRLVTRIDSLGFTVLHHVGITKFYHGGNQYGPALQLQEELRWFELVKKEIPTIYAVHHSKKKGTALEFFEKTHVDMLGEAKEWLKKTSESCSAVAVLVATVVFAAAYTVPGGLNEKTGSPVLLMQPVFMVFTVMDIVALAASLSSVVMFLSILTSSFRMEDFLQTLPFKLSFGFQLLFLSVASTMSAFALTIVLTVKSKKKWTMTLLYLATFFPVMMFIIIQLPLYAELAKNIWSYRNKLLNILPTGFIAPLCNVQKKFVIKKSA